MLIVDNNLVGGLVHYTAGSIPCFEFFFLIIVCKNGYLDEIMVCGVMGKTGLSSYLHVQV